MSNNFDAAIKFVLSNEGAYADYKEDSGKATNFGVTEAYDLPQAIINGIVPRGTTIKDLSKDQAIEIYKILYWDTNPHLNDITDASITIKLFDTMINLGSKWAIICIQRAIRAVTGHILNEDGILGDQTVHAINNVSSCLALLSAFKSEQAGYRRAIILSHPDKEIFLNNWMFRSYE